MRRAMPPTAHARAAARVWPSRMALRDGVCAWLALGAMLATGAAWPQAAPPAALLESPIGAAAEPAAPWRLALLPRQKPPATRFDVVDLDGSRVLRVAVQQSYGNLLRAFDPPLPGHPAGGAVGGGAEGAREGSRVLRWSWRVDEAADVDLRTKQGDDVALQVCVLYDWPHERLPLGDRVKLATARAFSGEALPTATICYVTDSRLPTGTWLHNAYTSRVRLLVVHGRGAPRRQWLDHERDLHADFRLAFADEWRDGDVMPPTLAVAIGGHGDNSASQALGYVRSIALR